MQEIERKFLLKEGFSELIEKEIQNAGKCGVDSEVARKRIIQTYVQKNKESEFRVRKVTNLDTQKVIYTQTMKIGSGLVREEDESEIDEETYNRLMLSAIATIEKTRYSCDSADIDMYDNGLCTLEIEFESEEDAIDFTIEGSGLEDWVEKEVTGDKTYSNFQMALKASMSS